MDIDELCEIVNRTITEAGIEVTDGRTAQTVTPRNVRYYRTIGLLEPPRRDGGRAVYDDDHVRAIVAIKRAQAAGRSLEELKPRRVDVDTAGLVRMLSPSAEQILETPVFAQSSALSSAAWSEGGLRSQRNRRLAEPTGLGWSVRIGDKVLSGFGPPPDAETLRQLTALLATTPDEES